ncbi:hypothetical protein J5N97_018364 [Dioscorea zingiberensis]|uniref:Uncharacterized protein n=1 Tax=Dioscorea zingiberensis TaxID=325984 RepID=A0A9D5HH90_9LILI|nr:hypothetical protein J5N97_018364 [Dioscorea zingiberensis]
MLRRKGDQYKIQNQRKRPLNQGNVYVVMEKIGRSVPLQPIALQLLSLLICNRKLGAFFLPIGSSNVGIGKDSLEICSDDERGQEKIMRTQMASFIATRNSVTTMVAGKEGMKQAVAKDLSLSQSSPWFRVTSLLASKPSI